VHSCCCLAAAARENLEGEYSGLEHEVVDGVVESLKVSGCCSKTVALKQYTSICCPVVAAAGLQRCEKAWVEAYFAPLQLQP
jgi:hypothetical protein